MFERYTEMSRRVIFWGRYFAGQIGSPEIETEHLLLGLLRADQRLARRFLGSPWAAEDVWQRIEHSKSVSPKTQIDGDLPLNSACKRAMAFAKKEADQRSSQHVCTEHLLLGLLCEDKCHAAEILHERGVHLASTREELARIPHDDSVTEEFVRERDSLPEDVVELQTRIKLIVSHREDAIANHDFVKARKFSQDERKERELLYLLCRQYGLSGGWLYYD